MNPTKPPGPRGGRAALSTAQHEPNSGRGTAGSGHRRAPGGRKTAEPTEGLLREIQARTHANCVICGGANSAGLGLDFAVCEDGSVEAAFDCPKQFEGYAGIVHGGIIASALDGAMANCLFAREVVAVTADLRIRFRHPVATGWPATVRAWSVEHCGPLHVMQATLTQSGQTKATANAKFMELPPGTAMEEASPDHNM